MGLSSQKAKLFLETLHEQTTGDAQESVSMYETGNLMGLSKEESAKLAEELMGKGWVEVKTLSGAIGITREGIDACLESHGGLAGNSARPAALSAEPFLDDVAKSAIHDLLLTLKTLLPGLNLEHTILEEIFCDIKTLEMQLLSPRPKTAIARALLHAFEERLPKTEKSRQLSGRIHHLLGS